MLHWKKWFVTYEVYGQSFEIPRFSNTVTYCDCNVTAGRENNAPCRSYPLWYCGLSIVNLILAQILFIFLQCCSKIHCTLFLKHCLPKKLFFEKELRSMSTTSEKWEILFLLSLLLAMFSCFWWTPVKSVQSIDLEAVTLPFNKYQI